MNASLSAESLASSAAAIAVSVLLFAWIETRLDSKDKRIVPGIALAVLVTGLGYLLTYLEREAGSVLVNNPSVPSQITSVSPWVFMSLGGVIACLLTTTVIIAASQTTASWNTALATALSYAASANVIGVLSLLLTGQFLPLNRAAPLHVVASTQPALSIVSMTLALPLNVFFVILMFRVVQCRSPKWFALGLVFLLGESIVASMALAITGSPFRPLYSPRVTLTIMLAISGYGLFFLHRRWVEKC